MKKTILAMAVPALLAAGTASAATVYDQDGVSVSIGGAAEVQIIQTYEFDGEDKNLDVRLDDGELNFTTEVAVSDSLTAIGFFDFENEGGSVKNSDLYAGLKGDFGKVTVGRQTTMWDDTFINEDIELGIEGVDKGGFEASGDNVVKYKFENDDFWLGVAHDLDAWNKDAKANENNSHTDFGVGTTVAGVALSGYYTTQEVKGGSDSDAWQLSAVYSMDAFTFGASYTDFEVDKKKDKSGNIVELLAGYGVGDFQYYLGYNFGENDNDDKGSNIYANVTYKMHSNVKTYAEVGFAEKDPKGGKSDSANGFLVGLEVSF